LRRKNPKAARSSISTRSGRDFSKSGRCLIPASYFFEFTGKKSNSDQPGNFGIGKVSIIIGIDAASRGTAGLSASGI
jgi:putative SOS response-associated peptidase YedK